MAVETDGGTLVVEGERSASPVATTSVEVDELPADADVASAVERVPGVTVDRLGGLGAYSAVRLRGAGARQVEVMLDGVPLNPDGVGAVNLSELPVRAFQRVDVARGGAAAALGSSASAGVVNLVSGEEPPEPVVRASVGTARLVRLGAQGGGAGEWRGRRVDRLGVVDVLHTRGDQVVLDDQGTRWVPEDDVLAARENADITQVSGHGRVRLGGPSARLTVLDAFTLRQSGVPGPIEAPTSQVRHGLARNLAVVQGDRRWDALELQARVWTLQRAERLQDPLGEIGFVVRDDKTLTNVVGLRGQARYAPHEQVLLLGTAEVRREALWKAQQLDAQRGVLRLTTGADLRLVHDRLLVAPQVVGLLIDDRAVGGEGAKVSLRHHVAPRLAVAAQLTDALSARANAGGFARPPDFLELFGDQGGVVGNPNLRAESGWQGDVGLLASGELGPLRLSGELGGFGSHTVDRITWVQNAQRRMTPVNLDAVSVLGAELGLDVLAWERVRSTTAVTHTTARQVSDAAAYQGKQLPNTPTWAVRQSTRLSMGPVVVGHRFDRTSGAFLDATNWYASPPRALHTATGSVRLGNTGAELELDVRNLLNRRTDTVPANPLDPSGSTLVEVPMVDLAGFPLPGRSWMLSMRWEPS